MMYCIKRIDGWRRILITAVLLLAVFGTCALADELFLLHDIPVIQLIINEMDLWDPQNGLFAQGDRIDKTTLPYRNALYRQRERKECAGYIRMTMTDGTVVIDQKMNVSLYGDVEMDLPNKSLNIRAEGSSFDARLFENSERTTFNNILLRNGSSDAVDTHIRECLTSGLLSDYGADILYTKSRNVALYINGHYWGLYQLEETLDESWASYALGIEPEQAVILNEDGKRVILGKREDKQIYVEMLAHIKENLPCESDENLDYLLERVDADTYIRFMAMWIYLGNADQSTLRIVRDAGGRWQYAWQDSTWCMYASSYNSIDSCTKPQGMGQPPIDNTVFLSLLQIPKYHDQFLTELGKLYRHFTSEKMISTVNALAEEVQDEMMLHCVRWRNADLQAFDPRLEKLNANETYQFWLSRIERLRNTCRRRPSFIWSQVQQVLHLSDEEMLYYFGNAPVSWQDIINDM